MASDDAKALRDLQAKWDRHWTIWRSRDHLEQPNGWCATRLDEAAGPDRTVVADTADQLNDDLHAQAEKARQGVRPLTISEAGPE